MKHLLNKTVWLIPTGNKARRDATAQKALVKKVGRVWCEIIICGYGRPEKLRFDGEHLSNECNGGYIVFESESDLIEWSDVRDLSKSISKGFQYQADWKALNADQLRRVLAITQERL